MEDWESRALAAEREIAQRELHHFETEQAMTVALAVLKEEVLSPAERVKVARMTLEGAL